MICFDIDCTWMSNSLSKFRLLPKYDIRNSINSDKFSLGAALECENWSGWTPIMYAAYYGHLNIVTLLVHNKANVNALNKRLATPLTCAARCGHQSVLEFLLENGAMCDPVIQVGDVMQTVFVTPLMAAAQHGHIQIVSLLVQYQANVDYQNPDTGYTALMLAAINDHLDIVELLISTGCANPNITNCRNQTALQLSAQCKVREVEMFLLEKTKKRVRILSNSYNIQNDLIEVSKGTVTLKLLLDSRLSQKESYRFRSFL